MVDKATNLFGLQFSLQRLFSIVQPAEGIDLVLVFFGHFGIVANFALLFLGQLGRSAGI